MKKNTHPKTITALFRDQPNVTEDDEQPLWWAKGPRPEPFNSTPVGVNSISHAHLHVRPMGRTCR